jgi:hypothetical protein
MADDLESDILASMQELKGEPVSAPVAAEPVQAAESAVESAEPVDTSEPKTDANGRVRGPDGKFAPKTKAEEGAQAAEPAQAASAEPKAATALVPPADWPAEAKAAFMEAPEHVQKAIIARAEELESGRKEVTTKSQEFERLNKVIEPMVGKWAMQGLTPDAAIGQLVSAANLLQQNPRDGFEHLLRTYAGDKMLHVINDIAGKYGYALAQANPEDVQQDDGQQAAYADPQVRRLEEQLRELTQWKQTREQAEQASTQASLLSEVDAVRKDPKNIYFENVKTVVAALATQAVNNGDKRPTKEIVQDCYDRAVWADPTTRTLLQTAQQKADAEAARKAAAAKAAAARQASGSITGSPGVGASIARPNGSKQANHGDDIAADLMAALNSARA